MTTPNRFKLCWPIEPSVIDQLEHAQFSPPTNDEEREWCAGIWIQARLMFGLTQDKRWLEFSNKLAEATKPTAPDEGEDPSDWWKFLPN